MVAIRLEVLRTNSAMVQCSKLIFLASRFDLEKSRDVVDQSRQPLTLYDLMR